MEWWQSFFDADYMKLWGGFLTPERTAAEADALWKLLRLAPGQRVLDAPCGAGRLSKALAERGVEVVGVDFSPAEIEEAEKRRGDLGIDRLRYLRADLRERLDAGVFDAAFNVFSSLGYGTEADDLAVLRTIAAAVRPLGLVIVETQHRDSAVASFVRGGTSAMRLDDGTLLVEEPRFDALAGRVETSWHWQGPSGSGTKSASLRIYAANELIALLERAGLRLLGAYAGLSDRPFLAEGPMMGGRLALLAMRDATVEGQCETPR